MSATDTLKKKGVMMKTHKLTMPEIGLVASTRAMLGAGIGLLLSGKLSKDQRRAVGWTLVGVGAVTTIPLLMNLLGHEDKLSKWIPRAA
ncbi:MAG TPA: hypothetical protein VGL29_20250 [Blastocatellia bacterium]